MTRPAGPALRATVRSPGFLALLSGLLAGVAFTPLGGPVLPFLAFAPLAAALARTVRNPAGHPLAPFLLGCTTAVVAHGVGLYWMAPALVWRTPLAVPAFLLVLALIGVVAGTACGAAVLLNVRARWPLPLALAACWVGFEWLAARAPGVPYAWLNGGMGLAWHPSLAAGAELLGARFLSFWTVATGAGVAAAWGWARAVRRLGAGHGQPSVDGSARAPGAGGALARRLPLGWLALAGLPALAGLLRQSQLDAKAEAASGAALRVAAVQTGRALPGEPARLGDWTLRLRELGEVEPYDLVAFPERHLGALREPGGGGRTPQGAELEALARELGVPVVTGAMDAEVAGPPGAARAPAARSQAARPPPADTLWYNAAFLQASGGPLSPPYRKARLVPGVESAGWAAPILGAAGRGYATGSAARPLSAAAPDPSDAAPDSAPDTGPSSAPETAPSPARPLSPLRHAPIGVLICYDSAYGNTARDLLAAGAQWLLVISNDDWLDPERPFRTTWAYWQHATHARLRAIENRVDVVQVGATGHTFAVSGAGRGDRLALPPGETGAVVLAVSPRTAPTVFGRTGDIFGLACFAIFALGAIGRVLPAGRLTPPVPRPGSSTDSRRPPSSPA